MCLELYLSLSLGLKQAHVKSPPFEVTLPSCGLGLGRGLGRGLVGLGRGLLDF